MKSKEQKYNEYVKKVTPTTSLPVNMFRAFFVGGCICLVGQILNNLFLSSGISEEDAGSYTTLILILLSVILTGFNIYPKIGKFGGAGALVPITGFANSVVAPAVEFKKEGQVFGIGCKIFTIAGPVILYGILTSWIAGFIYWVFMTFGAV